MAGEREAEIISLETLVDEVERPAEFVLQDAQEMPLDDDEEAATR